MNIRHAALPVVFIAVALFFAARSSSQIRPKTMATPTPAPPSAREIQSARQSFAGYQKWRLVNAQPFYIPEPLAIACAPIAMPSDSDSPSGATSGSHPSKLGKFIRVFVNQKGRAAMFTPQGFNAKNPRFPAGSVIVKQKLATKSSRAPELLTIMVKEKAGWDAQNGDWRYIVTSGSGKKIYAQGKLKNCQACHIPRKDGDYTFRSYLP